MAPEASAVAATQRPGVYRHTQFGWGIAVGSGFGLVGAALITMSLSPATLAAAGWMVIALFGTLLAAFALFATLTVEVDAIEIRIRFGVGFVRKTVPVADVLRCELIRTRLWWGWGLHWTSSGWLYNVSGRDAVRLVMGSERPLIVGSDDAPALKRAIEAWRESAAVRNEGSTKETE